MNKFKIIIGFLLLYGIGVEYISASKQLQTFFDPGIIIAFLILLFFLTWLIGSGLSKEKLKVKSRRFLKYYAGIFIVFLFIAFISLVTYKDIPETVEANGIKIDITGFMRGTESIVPERTARVQYCKCVVTKLANNEEIRKKYKEDLETGRIDKILVNLKDDPKIGELGINECLGSTQNSNWTGALREGMKVNILKNLREAGFEKTNDIGKYCDCLLKAYTSLPVNEVASAGFYDTKKSFSIDSLCRLKSMFK